MFLTLFGVSLAAAIAADIYDVTLTSQGLKKGVAEEGFAWLIGSKPSTRALYLRDALITGIVAAIPLTLFLAGSVPVAYGTLVGLGVVTIKHIQGALNWRFLNKGGKLDFEGFPIPADGKQVSHSAWAKFVGPWIW